MQIEETLETLFESSFNVKAVITDNHSTKALSFKILRSKYGEKENKLSFTFLGHTIYNLYDSVHLIKNVRNKLVNSKRFVFPSFEFNEFEDNIHVDAGETHGTYYTMFMRNLKKAYKLTQKTLHPGNNIQSVPLALNIFNDTTSAAILSYFPNEATAAAFLKVVNIWWIMSNSKSKYNTHNRFGNATTPCDKKTQFFSCSWCSCHVARRVATVTNLRM